MVTRFNRKHAQELQNIKIRNNLYLLTHALLKNKSTFILWLSHEIQKGLRG